MTTGLNNKSLSLDAIGQSMLPQMRNSENQMASLLNNLGPTATAQDLLEAQSKMSQWTLLAQLQSTLVKEIGDALKGIVQKAG